MSDEFRVPVARVPAELWLADGSERSVTLFCPSGETLVDLLESDRPFLPAMVDETVLLFSRSCVAVVWSDASLIAPADDGLPLIDRMVQVQLLGSRSLQGTMRFVPSEASNRTVDILNEPTRCLLLLAGQRAALVSKQHVLFLREV